MHFPLTKFLHGFWYFLPDGLLLPGALPFEGLLLLFVPAISEQERMIVFSFCAYCHRIEIIWSMCLITMYFQLLIT